MFVRQPQFRNASADVQIFYGTTQSGSNTMATWNKPPGVSHIYMLAIGSGGNGDGASSGGSGGVSVWYGAAQNVPDSLEILCYGVGAKTNTEIKYRTTSTSTNQLLVGRAPGSAPTGAGTMAANAFTASGFFQSVAGQDGDSGAASSTTFLSCGGTAAFTSNYGYREQTDGYFLLQPIIIGIGGISAKNGGVGSGGGATGLGGPGMVLIASW